MGTLRKVVYRSLFLRPAGNPTGADINAYGKIDGQDVQPFVQQVTQQ